MMGARSRNGGDERGAFSRMGLDLTRRIQSLMIEAELDGVPFSLASLADFLNFITEMQPRSRPALFLNDNGNLRALWRNDACGQIGIQFLGGGEIQCVILRRHNKRVRKEALRGLFSQLTDEQKAFALAWRGPEDIGRPGDLSASL